MPEEQKILHVEIDGTWTLDDFSDSLRSISDIYGLRGILAIEEQSLAEMESFYDDAGQFKLAFPRLPRRIRNHVAKGFPFPTTFPRLINPSDPSDALRLLEPQEQLYVKRIQFASPGFTDLAGLGTIVGHVKDFLLRLIELCTTREQRELENRKKRIEIAREYLSLARELGYTEAEMRPMVHWVNEKQAKLLPPIDQGKIHSVQVLKEKDNEKP